MWRNSAKVFRNTGVLSPSSVYAHNSYRSIPNSAFRSPSAPAALASQSPSDPSRLGFLPARSDAIRPISSVTSNPAAVIATLPHGVELARHYGRCFWELSKARLSMLVVATSGTGYVLGSGSVIDLAGLCWTCTGTMMVAASANSLNQAFEVSNDAKMKRTRLRPLPSGRMTVPQAVAFASSVGLAGTSMLACKTNMMATGLAASTLVLYAFVYTPLKQIHPVNTWVGAVVGAIPPLLGWAAASGEISLNAMILPAALYFWQIPHFMALAYMLRNDYAAGGYKMLSLADTSGRKTALVALRNCIYLVPLGFLAYDWGMASGWFCLESTILTLAIGASAFSFYREPTMEKAKRMFYASLLYLPIFMTGILLHRNTRPPVAYASVAPFPFLPAPSYAPS
ncbi:Protoheme IX farnesyltransferase, mitochondrial [Linum grandiflorum]